METNIKYHFWHSIPEVLKIVDSMAKDCKIIVDVGAGYTLWPGATDIVDYIEHPLYKDKRFHKTDICRDTLPFENKTIDFLYTRHTLEDIYNPLWVCKEINRTAKAGYIETPSPIAEFCRRTDAGKPQHRGYIHHRYFIWHEGDTLIFLPKYPCIEYMDLGQDIEDSLFEILNRNPFSWNTYFFWQESFKFKMLQHDIDFRIQDSYKEIILRGIEQSKKNIFDFIKTHKLDELNGH